MAVCGIVLTGGGARAAYQVGVMKALAQIFGPTSEFPFQVFSGISAGAINGAFLASRADNFTNASNDLVGLWSQLTPDRVYKTDAMSLMGIGARWIKGLSTGGLTGSDGINYLLDARPLAELLNEVLPMDALADSLKRRKLRGFAVTATNYASGTAVTFFDGDPSIKEWTRSRRLAVRTPLQVDHILASAAIPMFFRPVKLEETYYGDGCIRMTTPLSPALHLGADRILAVSVRHDRSTQETLELNSKSRSHNITLSEIGGVLLNAVFLDSLDSDIERLERINRTLSLIARPDPSLALRKVPLLALRPSKDLGALARDQYRHFPRTVRYLLRGIGAEEARGSDLLSYLAFDPSYVNVLIELGMSDTLKQRKEIEAFLSAA